MKLPSTGQVVREAGHTLLSAQHWRARIVLWTAGAAVGAAAVGFAWLADEAQGLLRRVLAVSPWWPWLLSPLGFALIAWLTRRFFRGAEGSGIPQTISAQLPDTQHLNASLFRPRLAIGRVLLAAAGLFCGGSIGREGPTVHVGAVIAHAFARFMPHGSTIAQQRVLILAGGAAGVSAAFNTPLAGIVFAVEELSRSFEERASGAALTAVILAGIGIWLLVGYGSFSGLWLVAIAFLLGQSARGALVQSALTRRIEGVRVADVMDTQPVAMPAQTPVRQALDEYFLRYGWSWFPVVDEHGRFVGIARQERVQAALDRDEGWLTVGAVLEAEEAGNWRVDQDRPLTEVLSSESLGRLGALMAVDGEGVLRGVVTIEQVRRALQSAFGSSTA